MALVTIAEAARLAGTARSNLYKAYIDTGIISVTNDARGKPRIDTSEILRVFGELKKTGHMPDSETETGQGKGEDSGHSAVIEMLKQQLDEAREREQFYQQQIRELTGTMKLIEHRPRGRQWWRFWNPL